jgi:DNA-binding NarL/FixJ family response regulator
MLSNILTGVLAQSPDIVVAGNVGEGEDLASKIRSTSADALILRSSQPEATESFASLLRSFPDLKVVAIDAAGRSGFVHQLRPYSVRIAHLSADVLQSALRADRD